MEKLFFRKNTLFTNVFGKIKYCVTKIDPKKKEAFYIVMHNKIKKVLKHSDKK